MAIFEKAAKWVREKTKPSEKIFTDSLETEQEYRERWRSIYVIYFTMFLISLGFSIIVTGVWPYLDKVSLLITIENDSVSRISRDVS